MSNSHLVGILRVSERKSTRNGIFAQFSFDCSAFELCGFRRLGRGGVRTTQTHGWCNPKKRKVPETIKPWPNPSTGYYLSKKKKHRFLQGAGINPDWGRGKLKKTRPLWELQQKSFKMTMIPTVKLKKSLWPDPATLWGCFWSQHLLFFSRSRKSALGKWVTWSESNIANCIPPTPTTRHMQLAHLSITGTLT